MGTPGRRDAGSVTAETAVALPALVLVLAVCLWVVGLVSAQLRCVEAARAGARAAARGEPTDAVVDRVRASAGASADVSVVRSGEQVIVRVTLRPRPAGVLGALLPSRTVSADATAQVEPGED